jgi:AcrR family transcriptional regulator
LQVELMKKRIDGRTAKGLRIRQQIRERLLNAYIDLIRSGVPAPTAADIAKRARLSLRVIFKHFSDLRTLRLESFNRMQALSSEFFSPQVPDQGSPAHRLERFVETQARRLEYVTPIHRTATMVESVDRDVAAAMEGARSAAARDLEKALGPTLKRFSRSERRTLLIKLHMVCAWGSWEFLRMHYRLSPQRARAIITNAALVILAEAERRAGKA